MGVGLVIYTRNNTHTEVIHVLLFGPIQIFKKTEIS